MYESCFSCWLTPQPVVCSLSNPENLNWRCRLSLKPWTGGVRTLSNPGQAVSALSLSLSNAGPAVSVHSRTLIASQVVLDFLALLLVGTRSSHLNLASDTK